MWDIYLVGFKRIDIPPNMAQMSQGLRARVLDTEDGVGVGVGCAEVK